MPMYALLGATGATGSAILRCLLAEPPSDLTLNVFVRSKSKLLKTYPDLESTSHSTINVTEAVPSDQDALQRALEGAGVIFQCIATNESKPGVTVAYDTVSALVTALEVLQSNQKDGYRTPTILQIRAAPLNETFAAHDPWLIKTLMHFTLHHTWADTQRACKLLETAKAEKPGLLDYAFVDTGAVHDKEGETQTGHELTLTGPLSRSISYADVGAGFCELAERRKEFVGRGVGVSATGRVRETWGANLYFLAVGLKGRLIG